MQQRPPPSINLYVTSRDRTENSLLGIMYRGILNMEVINGNSIVQDCAGWRACRFPASTAPRKRPRTNHPLRRRWDSGGWHLEVALGHRRTAAICKPRHFLLPALHTP